MAGGAWLIADMALNVWALTIVKATGADFAATQLVFLRAATGLCLMVPWIIVARGRFAQTHAPHLHLLRIAFSTTALTCSFYAIARLPLALFTAINFTRPLVLIALAALFLGERATTRRWGAAGIGLLGVFFAVRPDEATLDPALFALAVTVVAGTAAIIVTRRLNDQPTVVMMTAYTAGLALATVPFALLNWTPVSADLWPILLAIGIFSQAAQFCFLQAHRRAEAGVLAILGYSSLILSTSIGWLVFSEIPTTGFWIGAALIVLASWIARSPVRRQADGSRSR